MGRPYSRELDAFAETYHWALQQEGVGHLRLFLQRWGGDSLVIVGSGGSYSAAKAVAVFREVAHHSMTATATPLEFIASIEHITPRALLLSAEGKNKDVLAAARAAASADLATAAVTLTARNPLLDLARVSGSLRAFAFPMSWSKDGYLATNSLLGTVLLLYRAFFGDQAFRAQMGPLLAPARLAARRRQFAEFDSVEHARAQGVLLLHSPRARTFAEDLESKLAEGALAWVQATDFRQFAHGRHLQLAFSPEPAIIAAFTEAERALAEATLAALPPAMEPYRVLIDGQTDQDAAVSGLVDAMLLTEAIAHGAMYDPGQPPVPEFGRRLHALHPGSLVRATNHRSGAIELAAKRKTVGGDADVREPFAANVLQAARSYLTRMSKARFKAVICDFDGTLSRAENRYDHMDRVVVDQVCTLMGQGLAFALATGRGDSLGTSLADSFPQELHDRIIVGYYSGAFIAPLNVPFVRPDPNSQFEELYTWLQGSAYQSYCKPPAEAARGGQYSVRVGSPRHSARLRAAIRSWLDATGRWGWRVFCSGHSVDVLDDKTSKRRVVDHVAAYFEIDPSTEILRLGDCGQEDGNDFELLSEGLSLSCDGVSADLDSCWNFCPPGNNQAEATLRYLRALVPEGDAFRLSEDVLLDLMIDAK